MVAIFADHSSKRMGGELARVTLAVGLEYSGLRLEVDAVKHLHEL